MPKLTIKQWRLIRGKTQEEVANACGVAIPTIREWENNPEKITLAKLFKLFALYNITFEDIIFLPNDTTNM